MADVTTQIAFEELGLGSVLNRYHLRIPPNQREYSWSDREVSQLLRDFAKAINEEGPYFIGTIVTIPVEEGVLEVVDGQQRLATSAILLAAIRDFFRDRQEDEISKSLDNDFLFGFDLPRRTQVPKLSLNLDDNEIFKCILTDPRTTPEPSRASHELLMAARKEAGAHLKRILAPLDAREHESLLVRWVTFVRHRAVVVLLKVPDASNAYRMFETLNDRGLRTSQADLIKNFLFSKSDKRLDEAQNKWSMMRGALESASDDEDITIRFLRHTLILHRGYLREADVYERVQDIVKSQGTAVSFATILETLANDYVATFNSTHERWNRYPEAARRALDVLNLLGIKPMRPLILAIASRMDPKQLVPSFDLLISMAVRVMISGSTRSSSFEEPTAIAAQHVFEGKIDTADKLRASLDDLIPPDKTFQDAFERAKVSNATFARYYLRSLQMTANQESEPWYEPTGDKDVINLEHVLPKKPEGNWPQFDEELAHEYLTRIGNLALMRAQNNSDLKSLPFAKKRPFYEAAPYSLTSHIAEFSEWTKEAVDTRQKALAKLAVETWPIK